MKADLLALLFLCVIPITVHANAAGDSVDPTLIPCEISNAQTFIETQIHKMRLNSLSISKFGLAGRTLTGTRVNTLDGEFYSFKIDENTSISAFPDPSNPTGLKGLIIHDYRDAPAFIRTYQCTFNGRSATDAAPATVDPEVSS